MRATTIYEITITDFDRKYPRSKKTYKQTLIDNNFFEKTHIRVLPLSAKVLYLNLVLVANDCGSSTVSLDDLKLTSIVGTGNLYSTSLSQLLSLQLVTFEKRPLIKEVKKERSVTEVTQISKKPISQNIVSLEEKIALQSVEPLAQTPPKKGVLEKDLINKKANLVITSYCDSFKRRYLANPTLDPKDVGQIQRLCRAYGADKLSTMVQVYVQMEDPWFLKKKHDLTTFAQNLNKVGLAAQTGEDSDKQSSWLEKRLAKKGVTI